MTLRAPLVRTLFAVLLVTISGFREVCAEDSVTGYSAVVAEVLSDLAAEGNPDAMFYLGRNLMLGSCEAKCRRRALKWYLHASAQGHKEALREAGQILLVGTDRPDSIRREGMILLALSELSGDLNARVIMKFMPDIRGTPAQKIHTARKEALIRLEKGFFVSGAVLGFYKTRIQDMERPYIRAQADRVAQFFVSGGNGKPDARLINRHLSALDRELNRLPVLSMQRIQEIQRIRQADNRKILARKQRDDEQKSRRATASGEKRAYYDRLANRKQGAWTRLQTQTAEQRARRTQELQSMLELVNENRASGARLTIKELPVQ